jgi:Predicted transcriptional regulators
VQNGFFEGLGEVFMGIDYKLLGKNIKYYRKQKQLTQEQMAEQLDLSLGFISQVERGITKMSLDTLVDVCDLLGCSAAELLDNVQINREKTELDDFLALYEKLPKRDQGLFYCMLKAYVEGL